MGPLAFLLVELSGSASSSLPQPSLARHLSAHPQDVPANGSFIAQYGEKLGQRQPLGCLAYDNASAQMLHGPLVFALQMHLRWALESPFLICRLTGQDRGLQERVWQGSPESA